MDEQLANKTPSKIHKRYELFGDANARTRPQTAGLPIGGLSRVSPQISDMGLADHSRSCLRSGRVTPSQNAYFGDREEKLIYKYLSINGKPGA